MGSIVRMVRMNNNISYIIWYARHFMNYRPNFSLIRTRTKILLEVRIVAGCLFVLLVVSCFFFVERPKRGSVVGEWKRRRRRPRRHGERGYRRLQWLLIVLSRRKGSLKGGRLLFWLLFSFLPLLLMVCIVLFGPPLSFLLVIIHYLIPKVILVHNIPRSKTSFCGRIHSLLIIRMYALGKSDRYLSCLCLAITIYNVFQLRSPGALFVVIFFYHGHLSSY